MSKLPIVRDGLLHLAPDDADIAVGSPAWFAWLAEARSFTYIEQSGTFTARQEARAGRPFWYAYRQRAGRLRKVYLGRADDLTAERLADAAHTLASQVDVGQATRADLAPTLLTTKITMPQPNQTLIARPALEARCLESVARPCAIVAAPAGFGKTTLLVMACAQLKARGWRVAWLSLEDAETDPVRFWRYALAALDSAQPGVGALALRMLAMPRPAPIEQTLTALVNALADAPQPIVLVLDDYHRAASSANDQALVFLVEHAPTALHLIITTRSLPDLPLARLHAQGRLATLNAADLRFSADDAGRFLHDTMRVSLPEEHVTQLTSRTEGWVAGLQLAALSLREQADAPDLLADLSATHYIAEYLIGEALECQPADIQRFLLETAPLERLCGPLCDAVTGRMDGAATLAWLKQAQLFLTSLDHTQTWYRYHHLFAEVLRERLRRTEPDTLTRIHQRAADWLRGEGQIGEAIPHLLAAGMPDPAATLIEGEGDRLVLRGEVAGLVAWARALPRDILLAHSHLAVLFALSLVLQGAPTEASALLDALLLARMARGAPEDEADGEMKVARAILNLIGGDFIGGAALAREAAAQLSPQNHLLRALALWMTHIIGILGDEDFGETARVLTTSAEECLQAGNILVAFIALIGRAAIELYEGRLHRAAQTCREALRLAPQTIGAELPFGVMAHCLLAEISREWNDLDAAADELRGAFTDEMSAINPEFVMDGLITQAMLIAARGNPDAALAIFEDIRRQVQARRLNPLDIAQMEVMRIRVLIAQGRIDEAARWAVDCLRNREQPGSIGLLPLLRELEDLALARVALAQGRLAGVAASLATINVVATGAGRFRNALDARMLLARVHWASGAFELALRDLHGALTLAAPEGFTRVFLDEGEPLIEPLTAFAAQSSPSRERTHARALLAAFGAAAANAADATSAAPDPPALPDPLSPRELDVLRLLASGRSNDAIASELVVALSTVKWHIAHIYRKLGVTHRTQAVARARELRLIA